MENDSKNCAFFQKGKCTALIDLFCEKENNRCKFKKTADELEKARQKTERRLKKLGISKEAKKENVIEGENHERNQMHEM